MARAEDPRPDPMAGARGEIEAFLVRARRRKAAAAALHEAQPFVLSLFAATAALVLALRMADHPSATLAPWIGAGAALAAAAAVALRALLALRTAASPGRTALAADRRLRLEQALPTALDVIESGERGLFADALLARTALALRGLPVGRLFPIHCFWTGWAASSLLLVLLALLPFPGGELPPPPGPPRDAPPPEAEATKKTPPSRPVADEGRIPVAGQDSSQPEKNPKPQAHPEPDPSGQKGGSGGDEDKKAGGRAPLFGDPERTPAKFEDVQVKPLFGPEGESRFLEMEVPLPRVRGGDGAGGKDDDLEMKKFDLLVRYERVAEKAMSAGRVAPNDRKTVLDYFERVKRMVAK